jgi:histidine triad (HIT) family protein
MEACLFCATYKDHLEGVGGIIYEDPFLYAHHYYGGEGHDYLGHLMLKTKRHAPGFADLTEVEAQAIGLAVTRLSSALKICTGAEKVYVEAYGEIVPHLHLHLTARYSETPQEYWRWNISDWPQAPSGGPDEINALCDHLRASLPYAVRGQQ